MNRNAEQEAAYQAAVKEWEALAAARYAADPLLRAKVAQAAAAAEKDDAGRKRAAWRRRMEAALGTEGRKLKPRIFPSGAEYLVPADSPLFKENAWHDAVARAYWVAECIAQADPDETAVSFDDEEIRQKACLYLGLCKTETGQAIPDEAQAKRREETATLRRQTEVLAERLEAAGIACHRESPFALYHYYVHTGHAEQIPAYRRCVFLPYVAQMLRMPTLCALEAFMQAHPFCRFWTFTSGARCKLSDLRERIQYLHRKISKLNGAPFMQSAGVEIVLRSTELGTPEFNAAGQAVGDKAAGNLEFDEETGEPLFHPHAHCIVNLTKGFIPPEKWKKICAQVWEFWQHHLDLGENGRSGVIRNAREAVKYVTKPAELLKLSGPHLAGLWHQLRRLKLLQPLGTLAADIKARKEAGLRLVTKRTKDGRIYEAVKNWDKRGTSTQREKDAAAARKLARTDAAPVLSVVARLLPAVGPAGVKEPRVIILSNAFDLAQRARAAVLDAAHLAPKAAALQLSDAQHRERARLTEAARKNPFVREILEATADEFSAGLAIRVHTCTPTVRPDGAPNAEPEPAAAEKQAALPFPPALFASCTP